MTTAISTITLAIMALVTAFLCAAAAFRWRGRMAPLHWSMFVMMGIGAIAYFLFDAVRSYDIVYHNSLYILDFVWASRILRGFVLIATSIMAVGALIKTKDG